MAYRTKKISAEAEEEFFRSFLDWLDEPPNRDSIAEGGVGNIQPLMKKIINWCSIFDLS